MEEEEPFEGPEVETGQWDTHLERVSYRYQKKSVSKDRKWPDVAEREKLDV